MRSIPTSTFVYLLVLASLNVASAQTIDSSSSKTPIERIDQRFAQDTNEVPDFQKHVSPLLGRLGCNGRACHGSFQGRGEFQLSLFGYDFAADLKALLDEKRPRVIPHNVADSLLVNKPIDDNLHEGGKRFEPGGWEDRVLRGWIQGGALAPNKSKLTRLQVSPAEVLLTNNAQPTSLQVTAIWEDGSTEDVTPLCRFQSNDASLADVDEQGRITPGDRAGDSHIVVFYDKGVTPVPILRPYALPRDERPSIARTEIDRLVKIKLDKLNITPSGLCDDATFIRRVSLDLAGSLPIEADVRMFLSDPSPTKRQDWVEKLLQSENYAAWWTTQFCDWTGNNTAQLQNTVPTQSASELWYEWIYKRIAANVPYDEIVEGMVLAQSREDGETYLDFCTSMSEACRAPEKFAERDGMTLYWARSEFRSPDQRAIGFAHAFLGIRIQCAQCHKHPFDQWSKEDFAEFAKIFSQVQLNPNNVNPKQLSDADRIVYEKMMETIGVKDVRNNDLRKKFAETVRDGGTVPFAELTVKTAKPDLKRKTDPKKNKANKDKKGEVKEQPTLASGQFLGGGRVPLDTDARLELMKWLREKDNPYFAAALVNRVWTHYFGIGIVDPADDFNLANPPSNAQLLSYLANGLIDHNYDLQWLHRTIIASDTYQRSWESNASNAQDQTNFSHYIPHRLPAEVLFDAVYSATGNDAVQATMFAQRKGRGISVAESDSRKKGEFSYAFGVFGRSTRKSNCDCDRSDSPSVLQTIYLRNDRDILSALNRKDSWLLQVASDRMATDPRAEKAKRDAKKQAIDNLRKLEANLAKLRDKSEKANRLEDMVAKVRKLRESLGLGPDDTLDEEKLLASVLVDPWSDESLSTMIDRAYLRVLTRFPSDSERAIGLQFVREAKSEGKGLEGLLWALINTKEFSLNH